MSSWRKKDARFKGLRETLKEMICLFKGGGAVIAQKLRSARKPDVNDVYTPDRIRQFQGGCSVFYSVDFLSSLNCCTPSSTCGWTLTVWVFIRQPVVLVAMQLVVRVPGMALVLSRVAVDILALFPVAHLELISRSHTGAASVGWSEKVAEQKWKALFYIKCGLFISLDSFWSMLRGEIVLWRSVTINFWV